MDVLEQFRRARYVSLTTFRKDGSGVATPVWFAVDGSELFIVSDTREIAENEPNDDYRKPQRIAATTMPVTVNGQLEKSGDVD